MSARAPAGPGLTRVEAGAPLAPGERRVITVDGQEVALFNVEGRHFAIGNRCPHRGGPLSRGHLEPIARDGSPDGRTVPTLAVRCPIHGWLFDLATGRCLNQPEAKVPAYTVECPSATLCVTPANA